MIGQDKRIAALRETAGDDNEYSGWVNLAQGALDLIAERDALLQEAYENPEVASTSAWLLRVAELVVPEMQSAREGYVMGLIEHDEHDDPIATTEWAIKVLSAGAAPVGRRLHAREELRRLAQQHAGAVDPAEIVAWLRGRTGYGGGFTSADDVADAIERHFITERGR